MPKAEHFGDRLAQARREKGVRERRDILQKDIAKAVGTTPTTVSRWESGENVPDDDAVMRRLADYLGVSPGWLRFGDQTGQAPPILPLREPQRGIVPRGKKAGG